MSVLLDLFISFFLVAFVSFGGASAVIPEFYRIVVTEHSWMDARTFTELFAIAQAAPGPNVLIVSLIGQYVDGWLGALVATIGICLPMSLVVGLLFNYWDRLQHWRGRAAIQLGVAPLAVGLVLASGVLIARSAAPGWAGIALVVLTVWLSLRTTLHPLWLILLGALFGLTGVV
ncbi:MAG: chromate transporter [Rhodocyclaceae bacterium]|nr:chromate transporter [Rhodocyclaceae bacterium]